MKNHFIIAGINRNQVEREISKLVNLFDCTQVNAVEFLSTARYKSKNELVIVDNICTIKDIHSIIEDSHTFDFKVAIIVDAAIPANKIELPLHINSTNFELIRCDFKLIAEKYKVDFDEAFLLKEFLDDEYEYELEVETCFHLVLFKKKIETDIANNKNK